MLNLVPVMDLNALKEVKSRGAWLKQWQMLQKFVALNTMYRKTPETQVTCRTPKRCREAAGLHFGEQTVLEMQ